MRKRERERGETKEPSSAPLYKPNDNLTSNAYYAFTIQASVLMFDQPFAKLYECLPLLLLMLTERNNECLRDAIGQAAQNRAQALTSLHKQKIESRSLCSTAQPNIEHERILCICKSTKEQHCDSLCFNTVLAVM